MFFYLITGQSKDSDPPPYPGPQQGPSVYPPTGPQQGYPPQQQGYSTPQYGYPQQQQAYSNSAVTVQAGVIIVVFIPHRPIPGFLAHLWGAYAIPVALSGVRRPSSIVRRPSCVVCVHHNYQK